MNRIVIVLILFTSLQFEAQVDSLFLITKSNQDTNAVMAYYNLGKLFYKKGDIDSSYQLFVCGESLADNLNFTNGKIKIWRSLGSVCARKGNFAESKAWLDKGFDLIEKENLPIINKVDYLINLGVAFYYKGEIATALEHYIEATQICRENGFDDKRSMLLNNTGIFYRMLKRYDESITIYKESFELRKKLKDTMGMANNLHNLTAAYAYMGDYQKSLEHSIEAKNLYVAINSQNDIVLTELSRGSALISLERYKEAIKILEPLNNLEKLPFNPDKIILFHLSLSKAYYHENNLSLSQLQLNKIEEELIESDFENYKIDFYELKSQIFQKQNKHKEANVYLNKFIKAATEKNDIENNDLLKEMESKYLSQEKDYEIAILNTEKKISGQRTFGLGIVLALVSATLFVLFFFYRKIQNKNLIISESNNYKEFLLKEIHHRVKNNLQVISALLSLQSKYVKDPNAQDAIRRGHDRVESMALIHKDLYQHDNLKGVNTRDYLEKLIENLFNSYKIQKEEIELKMEIESIWLDVDTMIPLGLMINELLSNALKHAFEDNQVGKLYVSLYEKDNILVLIVKDNGKGMDGFDEASQKTFGYSLIQSFARKLDADVTYANNDGLQLQIKIKDYSKVS